MPTMLDDLETRHDNAPAQRLRTTMAAVRLGFTWFGVRKTLSPGQKAEAAATFDAAGNFLSAGKKLLDTKHPAYQQVTTVRGQIISFWKASSLPFPEPGIRLVRQDDLPRIENRFCLYKAELAQAVTQLDTRYDELKQAARRRLGRLFNEADYPVSLHALFDVSWEFPSIEPPEYLRRLSPALYAQEKARITARFEEAVQLAEGAFTAELSKLVSHLAQRLSGNEDGKPKIFRDSAVEHLNNFFERFRSLNIHSDEQLEQLVSQVQQIVQGIEPQQLRDQVQLRQQIATQLSAVSATLDGLMVDRPRRNLLRTRREVA